MACKPRRRRRAILKLGTALSPLGYVTGSTVSGLRAGYLVLKMFSGHGAGLVSRTATNDGWMPYRLPTSAGHGFQILSRIFATTADRSKLTVRNVQCCNRRVILHDCTGAHWRLHLIDPPPASIPLGLIFKSVARNTQAAR